MHRKFRSEYETIVIGGGIYGCALASALATAGQEVVVLERESDLILRASYVNQARVYHGYSDPRNPSTGLRSAANFPRFVAEFRECIDDSFEHVYAIAKNKSKVSSNEFRKFCHQIGAPLAGTSSRLRKLFNPALIEDVFSVKEYAFDAVALREKFRSRLLTSGVTLFCGITVQRISAAPGGRLAAHIRDGGILIAGRVFNCAYSAVNDILIRSQLRPLPLKFELAEVALMSVPDPLENAGITIIDGPFFSTMPFPPRGVHSLTHARYTPHFSWRGDEPGAQSRVPAPRTTFPYMIKEAQRYVPTLQYADYEGSLFEVNVKLHEKTVGDGQPILFRHNYGLRNLAIVLGSKIDNIYDALAAVRAAGLLNEVNGAHDRAPPDPPGVRARMR